MPQTFGTQPNQLSQDLMSILGGGANIRQEVYKADARILQIENDKAKSDINSFVTQANIDMADVNSSGTLAAKNKDLMAMSKAKIDQLKSRHPEGSEFYDTVTTQMIPSIENMRNSTSASWMTKEYAFVRKETNIKYENEADLNIGSWNNSTMHDKATTLEGLTSQAKPDTLARYVSSLAKYANNYEIQNQDTIMSAVLSSGSVDPDSMILYMNEALGTETTDRIATIKEIKDKDGNYSGWELVTKDMGETDRNKLLTQMKKFEANINSGLSTAKMNLTHEMNQVAYAVATMDKTGYANEKAYASSLAKEEKFVDTGYLSDSMNAAVKKSINSIHVSINKTKTAMSLAQSDMNVNDGLNTEYTVYGDAADEFSEPQNFPISDAIKKNAYKLNSERIMDMPLKDISSSDWARVSDVEANGIKTKQITGGMGVLTGKDVKDTTIGDVEKTLAFIDYKSKTEGVDYLAQIGVPIDNIAQSRRLLDTYNQMSTEDKQANANITIGKIKMLSTLTGKMKKPVTIAAFQTALSSREAYDQMRLYLVTGLGFSENDLPDSMDMNTINTVAITMAESGYSPMQFMKTISGEEAVMENGQSTETLGNALKQALTKNDSNDKGAILTVSSGGLKQGQYDELEKVVVAIGLKESGLPIGTDSDNITWSTKTVPHHASGEFPDSRSVVEIKVKNKIVATIPSEQIFRNISSTKSYSETDYFNGLEYKLDANNNVSFTSMFKARTTSQQARDKRLAKRRR